MTKTANGSEVLWGAIIFWLVECSDWFVCVLCLVELLSADWHSSSAISGRRAFVHDGSPRINCFSVCVLDSREGHVGNEEAERRARGRVNVDRHCVAAFPRLVCLANNGK